jgi:hypothetical protein
MLGITNKLQKIEKQLSRNKPDNPEMKIEFITCDKIGQCQRPFMDIYDEWAVDNKGNCLHHKKEIGEYEN